MPDSRTGLAIHARVEHGAGAALTWLAGDLCHSSHRKCVVLTVRALHFEGDEVLFPVSFLEFGGQSAGVGKGMV